MEENWKLSVSPRKLRFFWCGVLHEFLLAKDVLNQRQIEPTAFCDLCAVERESIKHILNECTVTKGVFVER
jgi:hypothetical protein